LIFGEFSFLSYLYIWFSIPCQMYSLFFAWRYPVFPTTFIKEAVFIICFGTIVKNKVGIVVWIHIWVHYSVPLVFISVFVLVPWYFYCYGSVVYFEVRYCYTSYFQSTCVLCICITQFEIYNIEKFNWCVTNYSVTTQ
jgi:hypothetical protein